MGTEKYTEGMLLFCDSKGLTLKPIADITLTTYSYSDIVEVESDLVSDRIDKVVFNDPATIVFWKDGTKTVVKCQENDTFNKETGLAMCIVKKMCGNKGNFNELFKKYIKDY